jgi:hypothetical protein
MVQGVIFVFCLCLRLNGPSRLCFLSFVQVVEFDLAMQREDAVDFVPVRIETDLNSASLEVLAYCLPNSSGHARVRGSCAVLLFWLVLIAPCMLICLN